MNKRVLLVPFIGLLALLGFLWASVRAQADPTQIPLCHDTGEPARWNTIRLILIGDWELLYLADEGVAYHLANHPKDYVVDELGTLTPEVWDNTCPPVPGWGLDPKVWMPIAEKAKFIPTPPFDPTPDASEPKH